MWRTTTTICVVLCLLTTTSNCFNLEVREPVVKLGESGSYFGYSVAEHITENNQKWLLVGAPLGQNLQPLTNHSGALYKCPLTRSRNDCQQVITDGRRRATGQYKSVFDYDDGESDWRQAPLNPPTRDEIKDGQWMGVTVRSQKPGGMVMVCGHRYITGPDIKKTQHGLGLCYMLNSTLDWVTQWEPCSGRPMTYEHQQFGYCQAGTSLAFLPDGTALFGAPGPYTWRGTIFAVEVVGDFLYRDKTFYTGPLNDRPEPIDKYSYLGMSVTAGRFFSPNKIDFASGAPRSHLHGQVYFFNKQRNEGIMNITLIINGEQFASNFGYEILSVDLNNDGYDDLLVAAPFYFTGTEGGAVYIYYNLRQCSMNNCQYDQVLHGGVESRFGFAMTSLGDINHDGYVDIAIGAPYEANGGAIYIYLGGPNGVEAKPSQKIQIDGFKTLGYSLNGGLDMDDNKYPDLLTGAYESDMVILFKTRPIIHIDIDIKGDELRNIDTNRFGCKRDRGSLRTCFSFEICFKLKRPDNYFNEITVHSILHGDIDKRKGKFTRVKFNSTSDNPFLVRYTNLKGNQRIYRHCQIETVYIKENIRDILSPIKFNITYSLANNETLSPILNRTSTKEFSASFQKDCGSDDVCQSNLILTAGLSLKKKDPDVDDNIYALDLGSVDKLNVEVNVSNEGDSAYEAQLFVVHPIFLSYIALNDKLSDIKCIYSNDTLVICNLGNPFQREKRANLGLRFESKDNNKMYKVKELEFYVFVNSTSEELSKQTSARFIVEVRKRANVKIDGAATSYAYFGGPIKGESAIQYFDEIGTRVQHIYQVTNEGRWTVNDLQVIIHWPIQVAQGKWLLYLEGTPKVEFDGSSSDDACVIERPFFANELNYTHRYVDALDMPADLIMPPINFQTHTRRRRQIEMQPEKLISGFENTRNNFTFDCAKNTATCAKIICDLPNLPENIGATIRIRSRIWNSTLVADFNKKDSVIIISRARIHALDESIELVEHDNDAEAITTAYPETTVQETSIPLWVYIAAVSAGILFFLLISLLLYKLGFFKRNRVKDPTLSGNLKKAGESESLLNK